MNLATSIGLGTVIIAMLSVAFWLGQVDSRVRLNTGNDERARVELHARMDRIQADNDRAHELLIDQVLKLQQHSHGITTETEE